MTKLRTIQKSVKICQGRVKGSVQSDTSLDVFEVVQEASEAEPLWPASAERGKKVAMRDPNKTAKIDRSVANICVANVLLRW